GHADRASKDERRDGDEGEISVQKSLPLAHVAQVNVSSRAGVAVDGGLWTGPSHLPLYIALSSSSSNRRKRSTVPASTAERKAQSSLALSALTVRQVCRPPAVHTVHTTKSKRSRVGRVATDLQGVWAYLRSERLTERARCLGDGTAFPT